MQRSGEDKHARLRALKVSILLFCFWVNVLYWLFLLRELGGVWPFASYAAIFGAALLTRFFINRSHRRQDELLSYPLTGGHGLTPAGTVYVSQAVWNYLEERMLILVSPLARAASEIYIQRNELDAGTEVVTRQTRSAFLRKAGLWEKLEPAERALIVMADGQLTTEQQNEVATWCEQCVGFGRLTESMPN